MKHVEVLELNGFVTFQLYDQVTAADDVEKIFSLLFKVFEQFHQEGFRAE